MIIDISRPNPALVVLRSDGTQNISDSSYEVVNWATEVFDHIGGAAMHAVAQDSRITIRDPGHFIFLANIRFAASGAGMRFGKMELNGSTNLVEQMHHGSQADMVNIWTTH